LAGAKCVHALVVFRFHRWSAVERPDRIFDGKGDRDRCCGLPGIPYTITQNRGGQAGLVGIKRNERRPGFELHRYRKAVVVKLDLCERKLTGERSSL
jgi:hypothetical protein